MSLATLPPELYFAILSHFPPSELQISTLNLSRAIPLAPVPLCPLFEHVSVSRQQQLPQLYRRLRYPPKVKPYNGAINEESTWVKSFSLMTWQVDADVLVNVLALLPFLEHLDLRMGPVFSPEHLREMFVKPALSLSHLNLRFRPYVQIATYYQFLKGSYFDSTLELISSWPSNSSLTRLSIIQDPLPPPPVDTHVKAFAQPIVFFSLIPLTALSQSLATQRVTHVRIRVPARQLVRFLTPSSSPGRIKYPFPQATFLDLSTCSIRDPSDIVALLNFVGGGQLQHLLLDNTGLRDGSGGEWEILGRTCALAGVKHSRDREKALKAWTEAEAIAGNNNHEEMNADVPGNAQDRRPRRGRRGLATATVSLRDRPTEAIPITPTALSIQQPGGSRRAVKIRILPSPPRLLSLCTNLPRPIGQHTADVISVLETSARSDFAKGWSEGLGQLRSIWTRLRQSHSNGVRVFRFDVEGRNEAGEEDIGMLAGLAEMRQPGNDESWDRLEFVEPPVLCFAGSRGDDYADPTDNQGLNHSEGCGHRISWDTWGDNL